MSKSYDLRPYRIRTPLLSCFTALLFGAGAAQAELKPLPKITGDYEAYVYADNLTSPDGLAIHPDTGDIYVTEEDAGVVSVIRNGQRKVVIDKDWRIENNVPRWALTREMPIQSWMANKLRSPEGLAFSKDAHLFVTEDVPNGRLLEFIPDEKGRYKTAQVHAIPWMSKPFAWEGVTVADDGRLFIAGSVFNKSTGLLFGSVLMRDPAKDWWIVDFGPFASFSSVALSRDDDILVVGDELLGGVNWWDAVRHVDVGMVSSVTANVESVCVLPDGAIMAAQEVTPSSDRLNTEDKGGRLVRIDPRDGARTVSAKGFGTIETVAVHPKTGYLYVTEDSSGSIIELRPKQPYQTTTYLLQRSVEQHEYAQGIAPKKWPHFLRKFVNRMGVPTADEKDGQKGGTEDKEKFLTLEEFAEHVPLIAGKIDAIPQSQQNDEDPVEQIKFVSFFPNQTMRVNDMPTPSLSLFAAKYKSGKVVRTKIRTNFVSMVRSGNGEWTKPKKAILFLPLTINSAQKSSTGVDVTVSFLGMGIYPDYHLTLNTGLENTGSIVVESDQGTEQKDYKANFVEIMEDGTEVNNLIIAGFDKAAIAGSTGWEKIGKWPVGRAIGADTSYRWAPRSIKRDGILAKIEEIERQKTEGKAKSDVAQPKLERQDEKYSEGQKKDRRVVEEKDLKKSVADSKKDVIEVSYDWGKMMKTEAVKAWESDAF